MVNPEPFYREARERLGIGSTAILVGLLRWHAGQHRARARAREALALEQSARLLAGEQRAPAITIDSTAILVAERHTPLPFGFGGSWYTRGRR